MGKEVAGAGPGCLSSRTSEQDARIVDDEELEAVRCWPFLGEAHDARHSCYELSEYGRRH